MHSSINYTKYTLIGSAENSFYMAYSILFIHVVDEYILLECWDFKV